MSTDHSPPPRPRIGGREDAGRVMTPPGHLKPRAGPLAGEYGTHLSECMGLWSIARGCIREERTHLVFSPASIVTVEGLAAVSFPVNLCTAFLASETLFPTKFESQLEVGRH